MRTRWMSGASMVSVVALLGCTACGSSSPRDSTSASTSPKDAAAESPADTEAAAAGSEAPTVGGGTSPCDLLTEPEMTGLFGGPVESTEIPYESVSGTTVQCLWNLVSESVGGADALPAQYVLVQVLTDEFDLEALHKKIDSGGIEGLSELVPDIGDGAILITGGEGINVAVGDSGFNLRIAVDPDPTPEAIKALAVAAVSRMT